MTLVVGLDTGGTFTDAALLDMTERRVVASAKSLTTRHDLAIGVGNAIEDLLTSWKGNRDNISLVSLSTTLATNAVVESVGGAVCLILIGFDAEMTGRAGLTDALGSDPVLHLTGGHRTDGSVQGPLDEKGLLAGLENVAGQVSSFAVASHFATRNPEHEQRVRDMLRKKTGLPVSCSYELSSSLGGPRRALTALLNARLISLLERLITATEQVMITSHLSCPLMVVKGDGSLLHADFARSRPVETILSGPAASLAGAAFLADEKTALVADIGGTTTDIALLRGGAPLLSSEGAHVGGWQTMVEAARIRTSGLGGDSDVQTASRSRDGGVILGPRRAIPLSLLSTQHDGINDWLEEHLAQAIPLASDARFIVAVMPDGVPDWLSRSESKLAEIALTHPVIPLAKLATTQVALGAVDRLVRRGLLMMSCFTPTDAAHILNRFDAFDRQAAMRGGTLLARQKSAAGTPIAASPEALAELVLAALTRQSAIGLMDAALAEDGKGERAVSSSPLLVGLFDEARHSRQTATSHSLCLDVPLIALGASAATHYPDIAACLGATLIVPEHADVAGAVGAAAGSVRQRVNIIVTQPTDGLFRVHHPDGVNDFAARDEALQHAEDVAKLLAETRANAAGARSPSLTCDRHISEVDIGGGTTLFMEATITAEAVGAPAPKPER